MLKFYCHETLTGKLLGQLETSTFSFNSPISGHGEAHLTMPIRLGSENYLKQITRPEEVSLYIKEGNTFLWGGPIITRPHAPGSPVFSIVAKEWKSWLYSRALMSLIVKTAYDQYQMAYDLIDLATIGVKGAPAISRGSTLSGTTRDFTVQPTWYVGDALDSFAKRDGGFEWFIKVRSNTYTGLPELFLMVYPQKGEHSSRRVLSLMVKYSVNGVSVGEIVDDASERVNKVWAIGDGQWPDAPHVSDEDPLIAAGNTLLREAIETFSGVTQNSTLFDHAHARRLEQSSNTLTIPVEHVYDERSVLSYEPGDRAKLVIKDNWYDIDVKGARIIDRTIGRASPNDMVKITDVIDLGDVMN